MEEETRASGKRVLWPEGDPQTETVPFLGVGVMLSHAGDVDMEGGGGRDGKNLGPW